MSEVPELCLPYRFDDIVTERLRLRLMDDGDIDDVHAYQSRDDVCEYLLYEARDRDTIVAKMAKWSQLTTLAEDDDYLVLGIEHLAEGRVIGDLYVHLKSVENRCVELGWAVHPDYQGRGYAAEAAAAIIRLSFETLGLHRIMAEIDPRNRASAALCRRLGMRCEAHFVEDLWFRGGWADTEIYAVLAREWRAAQAG
ncbi:GNAT family N-acetyltransferase [Microbacterium sp. KNMS]